MKRMYLLMGVAVTLVALLVAGCAGGGGGGGGKQKITLDFATFWSSGDFQPTYGEGRWMDTLVSLVSTRNATKDKYELEFTKVYSVAPPDLWSGVQGGTYDVITSGPGYSAGTMVLWEGTELGGNLTRKNALTMSMSLKAVYYDANTTALRAQVAAVGVTPMYWWSVGPGYFLMTEGNNVSTLESMAALSKPIRAATPGSVTTIQALNATPLYCAMSAALEKFQQGLLAGILCPTDTPEGFGLAAYVRSGTFCPVSYGFVFMNVMNTATWNSLPAEIQAIFTEVNDKWTEYNGKLRTWGEWHGLKYCYDNIAGFYLYDLPTENPTEYQRWVDACTPLMGNWVNAGSSETDKANRQWVITRLAQYDEYYATTDPWASWNLTPGETPPPAPTFPP